VEPIQPIARDDADDVGEAPLAAEAALLNRDDGDPARLPAPALRLPEPSPVVRRKGLSAAAGGPPCAPVRPRRGSPSRHRGPLFRRITGDGKEAGLDQLTDSGIRGDLSEGRTAAEILRAFVAGRSRHRRAGR
jgi:hypothetical protein